MALVTTPAPTPWVKTAKTHRHLEAEPQKTDRRSTSWEGGAAHRREEKPLKPTVPGPVSSVEGGNAAEHYDTVGRRRPRLYVDQVIREERRGGKISTGETVVLPPRTRRPA